MADNNPRPQSTISEQQGNYQSQRQLDFRLTNPDALKIESPLERDVPSDEGDSQKAQLEPAFRAHSL